MKIKIDKNITYEDFKKQIQTKPKNEIINSTLEYIKKYEKKYNMGSNCFYSKYNEGLIKENNQDFDEWYCKILMFSKYTNTKPNKINFINRG